MRCLLLALLLPHPPAAAPAPAAAAAAASVAVNLSHPQRQLAAGRSGMYNIVRHGSFWGQALSPLDPSYAPSFTRMGAQHVCIFLYGEMDELSPAPNVHNFTKLTTEIDDMLAMGFRPFIRLSSPPSWVGDRSGASPAAHLAQQIAVLKSPSLRATFLAVVRDIVSQLFSQYGAQTRGWAFSALNEVGVYTPGLSGGNWDTGSQYLAVFFSEFAAVVKGIDDGLRPGGGLESTNSYEFMFYASYLNRTNQTHLLANASFLDHHHYGAYGNLTADLDHTLDQATISNAKISTVAAVLEANGLSHIEIWESERAFNADGWDGRCSNHTGGLFAALSIVSNAAAGLDRAFHWVDYGSSGYKLWSTLPVQDAYYAPLLLHSVAQLGDGVVFVAVTVTNPSVNVYSWSASPSSPQRVVVVAFNRRSRASSEDFALVGLLSPSWLIAAYEYSVGRTINSSTPLTMFSGHVTDGVLKFAHTFPAYSFSIFVLTPDPHTTTAAAGVSL
jgi:hypothetical protein